MVTVVAAAVAVTRSTLAAVGIALAALIALSIAGSVSALHHWLPSTLAGVPVDLLIAADLSDFVPAFAIAAARVGGVDRVRGAPTRSPRNLTGDYDRT